MREARPARATRSTNDFFRADMQIFRQIVPPMRRSRSDRCARRDPRARRGSPMIRRADMRVGQTVPPLRRSHSDRCAKRDPRARRVRQMISRADMRIFRQTVPPLRRSHSDRCAQRDARARRARQKLQSRSDALSPFKRRGLRGGGRKEGRHYRAQARQGGMRARARSSSALSLRSERRFRLPSGSERQVAEAYSGEPAVLRRRAKISSPASERRGRRATPSSPCA